MANSMTGFGRGTAADGGRRMTVELKSVNHRFLDVSMRLPRNLSFLDEHIRRAIAKHIRRGHVDVYVNYENTREDSRAVAVNEPLLRAYAAAAESASSLLDAKNDVSLSLLLRFPDVLSVAEPEEDEEVLASLAGQAADMAAAELTAMRAAEGGRLSADILARVALIDSIVGEIESRAQDVVDDYAERLRTRIAELIGGSVPLDEARLATEVAYFADKSNITEEIVRLKSHIVQMRELMAADEANGRKLDFLLQEMNREANTIGSKANDAGLAGCVIEIKAELEKIREQIQNLE